MLQPLPPRPLRPSRPPHLGALNAIVLAPGEHLLTFEATVGTTTLRRDVRFTVR